MPIQAKHAFRPPVTSNLKMRTSSPTSLNQVQSTRAETIKESYQDLTAGEKWKNVWGAINKPYPEGKRPKWTGREPLALVQRALTPFQGKKNKAHMEVTMKLASDWMPEGREKPIHTYGAVAGVKFVSENGNPYTGLFKTANHGLVRLSLANKPSEESSSPGAAFKFFVDGKPSRNFMAMFSLEGQTGHNFFKNPFSNHIKQPESLVTKFLAQLFGLVAKDPTKVDVSHLAKVTENGVEVTNPVAPVKISLVPNKALSFAEQLHDVRDDFASIDKGTILYDVEVDGKKIGHYETTTEFVSSKEGDEGLFFRHEEQK